jgi:hypothetical protein
VRVDGAHDPKKQRVTRGDMFVVEEMVQSSRW